MNVIYLKIYEGVRMKNVSNKGAQMGKDKHALGANNYH
jgi:hypothetical protein